MSAVNLYVLSRVKEDSFQQTYKALGNFEDSIHEGELFCIKRLATHLMEQGVDIKYFDDFWYSYRIPHISKEFDLMKLEPGNFILNIELKTGEINKDRIKKQLEQNVSYLKLFNTKVISFTFVAALERLYFLKDNKLVDADFSELAKYFYRFGNNVITDNLDKYFQPSIFLVSPLTNPEKFLNDEFFLTEQQKHYKNSIVADVKQNNCIYIVKGEPGTGKTLLLYDIAKELSKSGKCLIIHGAELCDGHHIINASSQNITIKKYTELTEDDKEIYDYYFVDELQRIITEIEDFIIDKASSKSFILSCDEEQVITQLDVSRGLLNKLISSADCRELSLTNLFRINKHVAAFYKKLFDLDANSHGWISYSAIDVVYAEALDEAQRLIDYYISTKDYVFLKYNDNDFGDQGFAAHQIIGQEFDNVMTVLGPEFYYDKKNSLKAKSNSKYDMVKMLYQNITRTRTNLCLLIYDNYPLYKQILSIRNHEEK